MFTTAMAWFMGLLTLKYHWRVFKACQRALDAGMDQKDRFSRMDEAMAFGILDDYFRADDLNHLCSLDYPDQMPWGWRKFRCAMVATALRFLDRAGYSSERQNHVLANRWKKEKEWQSTLAH